MDCDSYLICLNELNWTLFEGDLDQFVLELRDQTEKHVR